MEINIPKTSEVMKALLKADYTTLWRNRRATIMVLIVPMIIVFSWKSMASMPMFGGAFVLSNAITLGLVAIGLMGYTNSIARDREKGVFQRLRVSPLPLWTIMASRLLVQLTLILVLTIVVFISGYQFDHITMPASGYAITFLVSIVGGAVYLALGQAIVGRIQNPETVNSSVRLIYFAFIMVGMFGQFDAFGPEFKKAVVWTPYGTVREILANGLEPAKWTNHTSMALLVTIGYTIIFATLGIKWFKWSTR
ncbi:ABC transporter permease [Mucilaginibacter sp.]|jgi:ABC-2 type transport system permease protein|uniref:ABC transporter permease n=1 Tax=Mucilaginibacter sp. TaxID=1882438 RepID=UPI002C92833E|nr:ABC transporter permease [Mucilaginibacter sp.]HTI58491.1 ABC transporter permease [Mucilaginibacter sp.]